MMWAVNRESEIGNRTRVFPIFSISVFRFPFSGSSGGR